MEKRRKNTASQEHLQLSSFIKEVHHSLRVDAAAIGFEAAWSKHCKDSSTLQEYAQSMSALAQEHWEQNSKTDFAESRIQWAHSQCSAYYLEGGMRKADEDEIKKMSLLLKDPLYTVSAAETSKLGISKIRLLDVGSCYNPFESFDIYDVVAVDIAPGAQNVKKCDFLNVGISSNDKPADDDFELDHFKEQTFDVVVFSLLLEYFPCAQARFKCCENAYKILRPRGILLIITPDSKHATANAPLMRQWRVALATLGFCRINYAKLHHLHCMVFRKSPDPDFPKLWATLELKKCKSMQQFESPASMIVIPQDSKVVLNNSDTSSSAHDPADPDMFDELPNFE